MVMKSVESILVTGMTSLKDGAMSDDNLGNFLIVDPLFRSLRKKFPHAQINTTILLSSDFNLKYGLKKHINPVFWKYNWTGVFKNIVYLFISLFYFILKKLGINFSFILTLFDKTKLIYESDIVIDFSGDLFGDNNLNFKHFISGVSLSILCYFIERPIYMVASSTGPFSNSFRRWLYLKSIEKYNMVFTREPISLYILNALGFIGGKYSMKPCFSFGFNKDPQLDYTSIYEKEPLLTKKDKSIVGLIVCNLNIDGYNDVIFFSDFIKNIIKTYNVRVCLCSHRNKIHENGDVSHGDDYTIIKTIYDKCKSDIKGDVFLLNGVYSAFQMNEIVGNFDFLISGRIHGAVQGINQYKPTLIVDYSEKQNAHKLKGFALNTHLYDYVVKVGDIDGAINKFDLLFRNKDTIIENLKNIRTNLISDSISVWGVIETDYKNRN